MNHTEVFINETNLPKPSFQHILAFQNISSSDLVSLTQGYQIRYLSPSESLFVQNSPVDYLTIVIDGALKLTQVHNHHRTILTLFQKDEPAGVLLLTEDATIYPGHITALLPSRVLLIPKKTYLDHWRSHAGVQKYIQSYVKNRILGQHQLRALQTGSVEQKIAFFILNFIRNESPVKLKRKDIAEAVGVTTESAIRTLRKFEAEKLITTTNKVIFILDRIRLTSLLNFN